MGASEIRRELKSFVEDLRSAGEVAFLKADTADVDPAVGVGGIGFGDAGEGSFCRAEIALQEQADAVVVPALPVGFLGDDFCGGRRRAGWEHSQLGGGLRHDDDGRGGDGFDFPGNVGGTGGEDHAAIVVVGSDVMGAGGEEVAGEGELRVDPGEFAVVKARGEVDAAAGVFGNLQAVVDGIGGSGRDEVDVNGSASSPGVALVDGVAVGIDGERLVAAYGPEAGNDLASRLDAASA